MAKKCPHCEKSADYAPAGPSGAYRCMNYYRQFKEPDGRRRFGEQRELRTPPHSMRSLK